MKLLTRRMASILVILLAICIPELACFVPAAHAESEAGSMAGSESSLEAGTPGRGRRRGGRRAYWRRMQNDANKAARKEEQQYRATHWTGDHH